MTLNDSKCIQALSKAFLMLSNDFKWCRMTSNALQMTPNASKSFSNGSKWFQNDFEWFQVNPNDLQTVRQYSEIEKSHVNLRCFLDESSFLNGYFGDAWWGRGGESKLEGEIIELKFQVSKYPVCLCKERAYSVLSSIGSAYAGYRCMTVSSESNRTTL